jgi:cell division protein FtsB
MKPTLGSVVRYLQFVFPFLVVTLGAVLIGEQGFNQRSVLEAKKLALQKELVCLRSEVKSLERQVTLLRTDPGTIAGVAKRKLGMIRPDETVYIFDRKRPRSGP